MRDSGSNINTGIYFEVRATTLRPTFTQKDFDYDHKRPSTKGPPLRNYNYKLRVHNSTLSNSNLYIRGGHLAKHKVKKKYNLVIQNDHKQFLEI